jgi:ABC-type branched-subunit amino acid transport system substrate-binding protein
MTRDEEAVLKAVAVLNASGRSTNNSQIAAESGLPRTRVAAVARQLSDSGNIRDVSRTAAYHWRITLKGKQYQP